MKAKHSEEYQAWEKAQSQEESSENERQEIQTFELRLNRLSTDSASSTNTTKSTSTSSSGIGAACTNQQSLAQCMNRRTVWNIDDAEAIKIHKRIALFIAVDLQPMSVVEDVGFRALLNELQPR